MSFVIVILRFFALISYFSMYFFYFKFLFHMFKSINLIHFMCEAVLYLIFMSLLVPRQKEMSTLSVNATEFIPHQNEFISEYEVSQLVGDCYLSLVLLF